MMKPEDKICLRCGMGKREAKRMGEQGHCSLYGTFYGRHLYTPRKYQPKSRRWFMVRIGKRIFRDADGCQCLSCIDVVMNGLIVHDKGHAEYLAITNQKFAACGTFLNYRDLK